jgi:hypothetical protein
LKAALLFGDNKRSVDDHRKQRAQQQQDASKVFEVSGRENLKASSSIGRDLSAISVPIEEISVQTRVKELMLRLEHRERELILNHELDASKLCQLSRKNFMNFVELFLGERKETLLAALHSLQSLPVHVAVISEVSSEPLAKG